MIGPGPLGPPRWEPAAPTGLRKCSNARVPPWDARAPMPPAGRSPTPGLPASRTGRLDVSPGQADPMSQDGRKGTRTPSQTRLDLPLAAHGALTRLRHHPAVPDTPRLADANVHAGVQTPGCAFLGAACPSPPRTDTRVHPGLSEAPGFLFPAQCRLAGQGL